MRSGRKYSMPLFRATPARHRLSSLPARGIGKWTCMRWRANAWPMPESRASSAEDGAIVWRVVRVHALGVPLPARWFRSVRARESAGDDGRYHFDVSASMPIAGLLVHYRGWLDVA